jgi:uncharacterized protein YjiS (DUF1127 family)
MSKSNPAALPTAVNDRITLLVSWFPRCLVWRTRLAAALREWQWQRRGRAQLGKLNDHELADLGLTRMDIGRWYADARAELEKRIWRL